MEYKVLLRQKVRVYGDVFHVELRKYRMGYYQLVDVYGNCEHDRGIPYTSLDDAVRGFEGSCGVSVSDGMKEYLSSE